MMKNKRKQNMNFSKSRITRYNQHLVKIKIIFAIQSFDVKNQDVKRLNLNDKKTAFKQIIEKSDSRSVIILNKDFSFCYDVYLISHQSKSDILSLMYDAKKEQIIESASIE